MESEDEAGTGAADNPRGETLEAMEIFTGSKVHSVISSLSDCFWQICLVV